MSARRGAALAAVLALAACRAPAKEPGARFPAGNAIVVAGEPIEVDAPVVLWSDEPRYDAYREGPRFSEQGEGGKRYAPGRAARDSDVAARAERDGWTRALLAEQVELVVLHYDACGTSRECFRVLQDERKLSAHFLVDLDGTIYQTLDLADTAWHARAANARSIGIEIANVGAFPPEERGPLARWYEWREDGLRVRIPEKLGDGGLRREGFVARPARAAPIEGEIHGTPLLQHDFTEEQYRSLAALCAALARAFPRVEPDAPRDAEGRVRTSALAPEESGAFRGLVGHFHLQTDKRDPGPAFEWERFLALVRTRLAAP